MARSSIGDASRGFEDGGFNHGSHLAFDQKHIELLANVFVSMLYMVDIYHLPTEQ
jgi:hypothetical protein